MKKLLSKKNKLSLFVLVFVVFTVINSFLSKFLSRLSEEGFVFSGPVFKLNFVKNTGAAFSIFENHTVFLVCLAILAVFAVIYYVRKHVEKLPTAAIFWSAILLSGICGNMFERIYFGFVRDFFELTFIPFPVFNISDIYINFGVFAVIFMLIEKKCFWYENDGRN